MMRMCVQLSHPSTVTAACFTSAGHAIIWRDDNSSVVSALERCELPLRKQVAFMHASCTEWKNTFSVELYGRTGKIDISGFGASYGTERITYYRVLPQMGAPETLAWEYPMVDDSREVELAEFFDDSNLDRAPATGLDDALAVLKIIERFYKASGHDYRT
jgi:predicted dehydrogenase